MGNGKTNGRSFFFVHRQIFRSDHPLWKGDEYSPREAFLWLCSEAAFKARTVVWQGLPIRVQRGEVLVSVRNLGIVWNWSKSRVHRYLEKLKRHRMIGLVQYEPGRRAAGKNLKFWPGILTVSNYDFYQSHSSDEAATGMLFEDLPTGSTPEVDKIDDTFEKQFWPLVPKKVGKIAALQSFRLAIQKHRATSYELVEGMRLYGRIINEADTPVRYRLNPTTWINSGSWTDSEDMIRGKASRDKTRNISSDDARVATARAARRHMDDRDAD